MVAAQLGHVSNARTRARQPAPRNETRLPVRAKDLYNVAFSRSTLTNFG
jgi:hypothetical protein